ncbi:Peptidase family M23 [Eubacterium ruminantium]|nr:Peptidase family M23 [Eubacterium ruminantium]
MRKDLVKLFASATLVFALVFAGGTYISYAAIGNSGSGDTVYVDATSGDADKTEGSTDNTEKTEQTENTGDSTGESTDDSASTEGESTEDTDNSKAVVTVFVTDESGSTVTDDQGNPVTTEAATDENGNPVTTRATITIDPEELKKIQDQQAAYKEDLDSAKGLINKLKGSQKSFLEQIEEIDNLLIKCESNMLELQKKKEEFEQYLYDTNVELNKVQEEIDARYEKMKEHIRDAYESGQVSVIDAVLFSVNMIEVLNKTEYMDQIRLYDQDILQTFLDRKKSLTLKKTLQTTLFSAIETVEEDYKTEYEAVQLLLEEKKRQVNNFDDAIDPMQQEADKIEEMYNQLDLQIASYEAAASGGVYVSVDGKILIPSIEGKGGFLWPMPSSFEITSYFGYRNAPAAGASWYHRGVDIGCDSGSHVISAMDGTVIYTGYMGTGGITVMVDHGGGVSTVYHHLSSYTVKEGEKVSRGQLIAFSGCTGVSTGPHLHFGVRINGEYVDPLQFYR